ncbi:MAG: DUF881 domain-containing protein [Dermatophilaceae bacterium]
MTTSQPNPEPDPPTGPRGSVSGAAAWRRLARIARPRLTRGTLFVTLLAVLLGFAIATQLRANRGQPLESLREDELVRVLDDVTQNGQRLTSELRDLERTRDALQGGETDLTAAVQAAQDRAATLGILAGTMPATGPGVRITITDPEAKVGSPLLLDTIQELRDAGAEAIQIGGARVVAATYLTDADDGVLVSGTRVVAPYSIRAIGDPQTMSSAMDIPGGVVESVRRLGGVAEVATLETVTIDATVKAVAPTHAHPESGTGSPTK